MLKKGDLEAGGIKHWRSKQVLQGKNTLTTMEGT